VAGWWWAVVVLCGSQVVVGHKRAEGGVAVLGVAGGEPNRVVVTRRQKLCVGGGIHVKCGGR